MRILIVDDDAFMRETLEGFLEGKAEVVLEGDAVAASKIANKSKFDYCLLDSLGGLWKPLAEQISKINPEAQIGILSGDINTVREASSLGYKAAAKSCGAKEALTRLGLL